MVLSTTAAGIINHTARGFVSFFTRSPSEEEPTAFSWVNSCTVFGDLAKTTHSWPPASSRRAMFAPILPRPIMPICMIHSSLKNWLLDSSLVHVLGPLRCWTPQRYSEWNHPVRR